MSGIAGIIHFDGKPVEPGLIESMTSAMAHRGPDGINHWVTGSVALGQCMLRTTPESLEEHQPLTNEDGSLVLVMDGRVDNWEELRHELLARGAVLRDRSDAELVLRAFESWGRDCLPHMEGDFALVIWDVRCRQAFCARDRVGNKPFHYHWDGQTFVFASELHSILLLPWVTEVLNVGIVAEFLAGEWYSIDETFWRGVFRLVAAHWMVVEAAGTSQTQYWEPDYWASLPYNNEQDITGYYLDLLTDVVRRMSRTHQPLACEVSGGLDSSAIAAIAEHLRREDRLMAPSLQAYTLDLGDDPTANDLKYARAVGDYLNFRIHEIALTRKPLSWYGKQSRSFREFPGFPNGVMGLGIREQAVAHGGRALFTGVGGDEWMRGSRTYYAEELANGKPGELYRCLKADLDRFGVATSLRWFARFGVVPSLPQIIRASLKKTAHWFRFRNEKEQPWLSDAMRRELRRRRDEDRNRPLKPFRRVGQREQDRVLSHGFLAWSREMEERFCALHSIERRNPFFDSRLVQFSFSTPERLRLRGGVDKALHRQALVGLLPDEVLRRESGADFMATFRWHLPDMKELLLDIADARRGWVDYSGVAELFNQIGDPDKGGWPEWWLWILFGCDAVCEERPGS